MSAIPLSLLANERYIIQGPKLANAHMTPSAHYLTNIRYIIDGPLAGTDWITITPRPMPPDTSYNRTFPHTHMSLNETYRCATEILLGPKCVISIRKANPTKFVAYAGEGFIIVWQSVADAERDGVAKEQLAFPLP